MRITIISVVSISFSSDKDFIALLGFDHTVTVTHVTDCNAFDFVLVVDTNIHVKWLVTSSLNKPLKSQ